MAGHIRRKGEYGAKYSVKLRDWELREGKFLLNFMQKNANGEMS